MVSYQLTNRPPTNLAYILLLVYYVQIASSLVFLAAIISAGRARKLIIANSKTDCEDSCDECNLSFVLECTEGAVDLFGLDVESAGIVRLCLNGKWGTICDVRDTLWSEKNAQVACIKAGYAGAVNSILQSTLAHT